MLFHAAGVSRRAGDVFFRTAMSAGNLHPLEIYVLDTEGVHHFAPHTFGLTPLRAGCHPPALVITGIPWRTAWKYGERGWRHLYWDAGTMLANLLAVTEEAEVHLGFVDAEVAELVGVDSEQEFPLAIVTLGTDRLPDAPSAAGVIAAEPLSRAPITFPLILEAQRAGDLPDPDAARRWPHTPLRSAPVPRAEELILRRGSTRLFSHEPVSLDFLLTALAAADSDLLTNYVAVHAVDGLPPGTYRWDGQELVSLRRGAIRPVTEAVCLRQPLGGDAAFTVFHCVDLERVFERLGARGYRAAQLEAGVASGRLALAAVAGDAGATGLTFFDDQVSDLFETPDACMLVTAVGVPAYRNTRGGEPRRPVELTGYERVMLKLARRLSP